MKRFRKVLKWTAIVGGACLGILLLLNAWNGWRAGTRLERRLAELRAAGQPVQLSDLARPPIPLETNAAMFLRRAASDLDSMHKELMAWYPESAYPTGAWKPADQERLEGLFAAYPKVMPLLEQAAACPDYNPELDVTVPPSRFLSLHMERMARQRELYRILRARSGWLASEGEYDKALDNAVLMLRLARHLQREPLIIGYLVAVACQAQAMQSANEALQSGPVSSKSRAALDAELARHDNMDAYRWAFQSERAYVLSALQELPGSKFWLLRGAANDGSARLVELIDQYLADASKPYREAIARAGSAPPQPRGWGVHRTMVELLKPALNAAREPAERTRARTRSLRVLNALQARTVEEDKVPRLAELELPAESTRDPFNGEPLKYKQVAGGWTVYSVGRNLVDDGGDLVGQKDVGVGPIRPTGNAESSP